jgi:biopolymer transport protein ExbD
MKLQKFDSINVIPFIDVLLVLLAIVLMTSTFIAKGVIPVSLPKAKSANSAKVQKEVNIVLKKDNTLFLNEQHLSIEALAVMILKFDVKTPILIHSDKESKVDVFVQVLDTLKQNEFKNISIVTKK